MKTSIIHRSKCGNWERGRARERGLTATERAPDLKPEREIDREAQCVFVV